jgi:putative membrane protein insertion efficiency factor
MTAGPVTATGTLDVEAPTGPPGDAGRARAPVAAGLLSRTALALIGVYQAARRGRPSPCRFWPSCSEYARQAIEVHGWRRGGWLTARRLGRCRPLGKSGFDPVPPWPGETIERSNSAREDR